jgi:3-oxoacyl-(acyl-carrier-protein) synthase
LNTPISITAIASVSPLGRSLDSAWKNYRNPEHFIRECDFGGQNSLVAAISKEDKIEIEKLRKADQKYKSLDASVVYAMYASRKAVAMAGWNEKDQFGINIGSSRGATALFEKYHEDFLRRSKTQTLASPTTTLGNISSWVAHDLNTQGPVISHSITCSTALHAILNGVAWINSGMTDKFLVGGSEAALTPFTIAQMQAMKIYAPNNKTPYPCQAGNTSKTKNTMVLGEAASVACLEQGDTKNALAKIVGVGYATEPLEHNISISTNADCFQQSMSMALGEIAPEKVDVIVMHAPGTIKGDISELNAIEKIFCNKTPALTTNKWKVGHTLGASGMLSIELAILMLREQYFIGIPFLTTKNKPNPINYILVNAVGFGGNAVSVLLAR